MIPFTIFVFPTLLITSLISSTVLVVKISNSVFLSIDFLRI
nr:MAG TPA: hypothetical protein [Caudoviricetes sp.]